MTNYRSHGMAALCVLLAEGWILAGVSLYILSVSGQITTTQRISDRLEQTIADDLQCFPIREKYLSQISYEDSFGAARSQGGHEGTDIMSASGIEGEIPIVSATNGTVTNLGWLYLGGYRIGITSDSGCYYYYAHLASYAAGLSVGKSVYPGMLLGFMGSTGEGEEGTFGRFPVHLHFGIYSVNSAGEQSAVDPYPFLLKLEKH